MLLAIKNLNLDIYPRYVRHRYLFFYSNNYIQIHRLTQISFKQMQATSKSTSTTTTIVYFWIVSMLAPVSGFKYI